MESADSGGSAARRESWRGLGLSGGRNGAIESGERRWNYRIACHSKCGSIWDQTRPTNSFTASTTVLDRTYSTTLIQLSGGQRIDVAFQSPATSAQACCF